MGERAPHVRLELPDVTRSPHGFTVNLPLPGPPVNQYGQRAVHACVLPAGRRYRVDLRGRFDPEQEHSDVQVREVRAEGVGPPVTKPLGQVVGGDCASLVTVRVDHAEYEGAVVFRRVPADDGAERGSRYEGFMERMRRPQGSLCAPGTRTVDMDVLRAACLRGETALVTREARADNVNQLKLHRPLHDAMHRGHTDIALHLLSISVPRGRYFSLGAPYVLRFAERERCPGALRVAWRLDPERCLAAAERPAIAAMLREPRRLRISLWASSCAGNGMLRAWRRCERAAVAEVNALLKI